MHLTSQLRALVADRKQERNTTYYLTLTTLFESMETFFRICQVVDWVRLHDRSNSRNHTTSKNEGEVPKPKDFMDNDI
jgi:hypothetical protein